MTNFKVAMVDYDYDSLDAIEAEVVKLGGTFVHRRCADVDLGRWLTGGYAIPAGDDDDEDGTDRSETETDRTDRPA